MPSLTLWRREFHISLSSGIKQRFCKLSCAQKVHLMRQCGVKPPHIHVVLRDFQYLLLRYRVPGQSSDNARNGSTISIREVSCLMYQSLPTEDSVLDRYVDGDSQIWDKKVGYGVCDGSTSFYMISIDLSRDH